jgi:hypothetical protein
MVSNAWLQQRRGKKELHALPGTYVRKKIHASDGKELNPMID